jgi:hypothetical protein
MELKNASLSSRPDSWDPTQMGWDHPTVSARLGWRPDEAWNLGLSASTGSYLRDSAAFSLAPGYGLSQYRQILFGQDAAYARHHWQLWAEVYESRFAIPLVGSADTLAYYIEAKYKFTPQFFGAVRWNQQVFATLPDIQDGGDHWGANTWRIDLGPAYRFTAHLQIKLQYSFQHQDAPIGPTNRLLAAQLTARF